MPHSTCADLLVKAIMLRDALNTSYLISGSSLYVLYINVFVFLFFLSFSLVLSADRCTTPPQTALPSASGSLNAQMIQRRPTTSVPTLKTWVNSPTQKHLHMYAHIHSLALLWENNTFFFCNVQKCRIVLLICFSLLLLDCSVLSAISALRKTEAAITWWVVCALASLHSNSCTFMAVAKQDVSTSKWTPWPSYMHFF